MTEPCRIIRSRRKTVSLQINENGDLIVRVPRFISDIDVYRFIEKHKRWIEEKRLEIKNKKSKLKTFKFLEGEEFSFLGEKYILKFFSPSAVNFESVPAIFISQKYLFLNSSLKTKAAELIEDFYKAQAEKILEQRVNYYIKIFENIWKTRFQYRKIKLTNGRKNIGSCSSKGDLNFSWRIIQAPLEVIDYIVIHEIVHLKHKHHKKSFWVLVQQLKPDYKKYIEWIKQNWFYLRDFLRDKKT